MPSLPIYESEDYQMVNTNVHRHGLKRLLAFLLCAVCVFRLIPTQAFAMSPGQKASSWLGDQYVGSDGQHYYSPAPTNFIAYNSDGTTRKLSGSGGSAYRHYMLTDSDGVTHSVSVLMGTTPARMCICPMTAPCSRARLRRFRLALELRCRTDMRGMYSPAAVWPLKGWSVNCRQSIPVIAVKSMRSSVM